MKRTLFFDVFEVKVTEIDHKALKDDVRLRFLSNGRVKVYGEESGWRTATVQEIRKILEPVAKKYGLFRKEWKPRPRPV